MNRGRPHRPDDIGVQVREVHFLDHGWIPGVDLRVVSYKNTSGDPLEGCQGVILSGGVDVGPGAVWIHRHGRDR